MTDNHRYLSLDGTPAPKKRGTLRHVFTAESFAGIATTAMTAGMVYAATDLRYAFMAAACGAVGVVAAQVFYKKKTAEALEYLFGDLEKRCFDLTPDRQTPPTKPNHMLAATGIAKKGRMAAICIAGLSVPQALMLGIVGMADPALTPLVFSVGALITAAGFSLASNFAITAQRFNKVAQQEWVICDNPPPRKKAAARKPVYSVITTPDPLPI
jgi:hypothetical protein